MSNTESLASIVIVSRDRHKLLERAIASVTSQDYRPIELIIVDNQSEPTIAASALPEGISATLVRSPYFMNSSEARNFGIKQATGGFIGFLDDDDEFLPGKVKAHMNAFAAHPEAQFSYMSTEVRLGENVMVTGAPDSSDIRSVMLYRPIHLNCLMVRADTLRAEMFNEQLQMFVDIHLIARLCSQYNGIPIDQTGAIWYRDDRADQITQTGLLTRLRGLPKRHRNWKIICDDFASFINKDQALRKTFYGKQAALSAALLKPQEAIRYSLAALGQHSISERKKPAAL